MAYGQRQITFDKPGEGNPGDAADAAATEAAAKVAADAAIAKAAADAAEAKTAADKAAADLAAAEAAKKDVPPATDAEKADLLREVMDKKAKLKEAQDALKLFDGIDPVKVRELLKKEADAEVAAAEARGEFDRVKEMMATEHTKDMDKLKADMEALRTVDGEKNSLIDKLTLGNDFGTSSFIKEKTILSVDKARKLYGDHFEVKDGRTVAFDKPVGAVNRTMFVDSSGNALAFDEAISRIINADPDKDTMVRVDALPGGGSRSDPGSKLTPKPADTGLRGASRIAAAIKGDF